MSAPQGRVLLGLGMWEKTAAGYRLVDYLVDQPSREHVEATRAARAASARVGGQRSGET